MCITYINLYCNRYVNAKQYNRILKRRNARAKLEAELKVARAKKVFLYNEFNFDCFGLLFIFNIDSDFIAVLA